MNIAGPMRYLMGSFFIPMCAHAFSPYDPTTGWKYYVEAAREGIWPDCAYRFLSYDTTCSTVDLWSGAGGNQEWRLSDAGDGYFYFQTSCGAYLSYSDDCTSRVVDLWPNAGKNQKFQLVKGDNTAFEWYLEAVGRSGCDYKWMSFPVQCSIDGPDVVDLWNAAGTDQRFRLHPVQNLDNPLLHFQNSDVGCADPFVWWCDSSSEYKLQCTGGGLGLASTQPPLSAQSTFTYQGDCLGGEYPDWASANNRWAPENYEYNDQNYIFFSDSQIDGTHRIGWALSNFGATTSAYDYYADDIMDLGGAPGGDIDQNIFLDDNGQTYIIWKTDDNAVGSLVTRIFAQEVVFGNYSVALVNEPREIMDSTGLWWVDSWVEGGTLVEGPEIVKRGEWYYLFFASGKYCEDSYSEGVARSTNIWGPYTKLSVPLLSTGIVGNSASTGAKLIGPGHASIVADRSNPDVFWLAYHANEGGACNRFAYLDQMLFGDDGWPYVWF